jgi:small subunit ribosomal protein S10
MAVSSLSSTICPPFPVSNFSSTAPKPKLSLLSLPSSAPTLKALKPTRPSTFRVFAAPETLDLEETLDEETDSVESLEVEDLEAPESSPGIGIDVGMSVPKQKIRIKLRSYWVPLIEDSCKQILDAARRTNAKTMGPVPLPTKKRIHCVLKSPHVHKDARFHFEIRTHRRLIDIVFPTAETIDALMQLDLPAGVDVEVKL